MAIPQSMTYVQANGAGAPDVLGLATGPTPTPKPDEILIRVQAAGVNRPDVAQRQGSYPPPPGASAILGLDTAVASLSKTMRNRPAKEMAVCWWADFG